MPGFALQGGTCGLAAAMAAGGFLLHATGFDVALGGAQAGDTLFYMRLADVLVPVFCSVLAIWMVATYPITEKMAHETRKKLEERRGNMAADNSTLDETSEGATPA